MKKLLLTGFNRNQVTRDYWRRQEIGVVLQQYSIIRCLEDMGWEVDQREVQLGEDLSVYDEVICFLHSPQGFAHCLYSGLYALSARPDCILSFDDWQIKRIIGEISSWARAIREGRIEYSTGKSRLFKDYIMELQLTKRTQQELERYISSFLEGCDVVTSSSNRLLLSRFHGGDLSRLDIGWSPDRMFGFYPGPYHYRRTPENSYGCENPLLAGSFRNYFPDQKLREWTFASLLHNQTKSWLGKQNATWPVKLFGQRKGKLKTSRLTEDEMCQTYNAHWGNFMPAYHHSGSGWWRTRVMQVADAGSILVSDRDEGMVLYGDESLVPTCHDVEEMDTSQLEKLASLQASAFMNRNSLDKEIMKREIQAVLEAPK